MKLWPFLIVLLSSCGDYSRDRGPYPTDEDQRETAECPVRGFDTRLRNDLSIRGQECVGGEITSFDGRTYICERDQFLITLDTINSCTTLECTNRRVPSFPATLGTGTFDGRTTYYPISPLVPLNNELDTTINDLVVACRPGEVPTAEMRQIEFEE